MLSQVGPRRQQSVRQVCLVLGSWWSGGVREPSQGEAIKPQHGARRTWDCQDGGDAAFQRQAGQGEGMAVEVGDGVRDRTTSRI